MVRESVNEPWRTVSWDAAIDFAAQRLNRSGGYGHSPGITSVGAQ